MRKLILLALVAMIAVIGITFAASAAKSTVLVSNLQPSWDAPGGGGVFSAYVGPPDYGYESPGTTALYLGRQAGIIKAGLAIDTDGHYWDEGLFAFKPAVTIDQFAASALPYDVVNQYGTNPVWMTIEIDTGTPDNRSDNVAFQMVPAAYGSAAYVTVNAGTATNWLQWTTPISGITTGSPRSLGDIAADTAYTGLTVVRTYLRLGMGDPYAPDANGTQAWVDKASIGGVTYDFVVNKDQCRNGGWRPLGFKNQGDCASFSSTGK